MPDLPDLPDLILTATFPISAGALYDAWIDAAGHHALTGAPATSDPRVGGNFTAWDGYISGTWRELHHGSRLVMSWRTTEFPADAPDATVVVSFTPVPAGVQLRLEQSGTPADQVAQYRQGWEDFYFEPIRSWIAENGV